MLRIVRSLMAITMMSLATFWVPAETFSAMECMYAYHHLNPDATMGDWVKQFETETCEMMTEPLEWTCSTETTSASLISGGTLRSVYGYSLAENCTDYCNNPSGNTEPQPITTTLTATASKTLTREWEIGGGIEGEPGWLTGMIAKGKISVEASWGQGSQETCEFQNSIGVTLPPCRWQKVYVRLDYREGRRMRATVDLKATATMTPKEGQSGPCPDQTVTIATVTTTLVGDFCVGAAGSGTDAAGSCPPDPPALE
jgi:hypothetical protein